LSTSSLNQRIPYLAIRLLKPYLLLRNNKKSGPYSIEELGLMALLPQDLVWVDGKSSSWRNPGEIAELSWLIASGTPSTSSSSSSVSGSGKHLRFVSNVQLPDHRFAVDYDPWPPTLSYHLNNPGREFFWSEAGSDHPFADSFRIEYPILIDRHTEEDAGSVIVKLVTESGYAGRGRRIKGVEDFRVTPVFERSSTGNEAHTHSNNSGSGRIAIEFLSDDWDS
jgi:hypothetical protein